MPNQPCPGFQTNVASGTAWDFASEGTGAGTVMAAQQKADGKAVQAALTAMSQNLCTPPCVTIPNIRFTSRRSTQLHTPEEHPFSLALAFTVWELDILCINPLAGASGSSAGPAPLTLPPFTPPTVPAETAPVHGGSKTHKKK